MSSTPAATRHRVLFLNRSYWPDAEASGQLLTELCQDLAQDFEVEVIAGQPNQNPDHASFRRCGVQRQGGVTVRRVLHLRLSKRLLPARALNLVSYLFGAAVAALRAPQADVVVVETDPPLLCFLGRLLQKWRGVKLVVYLQDIYPDIAVALGKLPAGPCTRWLRRKMFGIYRQADRVVVLSRDMKQLLMASGVAEESICCIPNWTDTSQIVPLKQENPFRQAQGLCGKFVVMYSGNMGLCQRLEDVIEAAGLLTGRSDIELVLIGDGALKEKLLRRVEELELRNVRFLPYQPKRSLGESLSAADIHLLPLDPCIASCLMPSKLYGILASGSPALTIAPGHCELAEITRRERIGLTVEPGDPAKLADAIEQSAALGDELQRMGARARALAERCYTRRQSTTRFASLLKETLGPAGNRSLPARIRAHTVP